MEKYPRIQRRIDERASAITDELRQVARRFGQEFFDGDRLCGYGGYRYHPRFWQETVRYFRDHYGLKEDAAVLDVGCAKGFMLHDFKMLMPKLTVSGIDVSEYALIHAIDTVRPYLALGNAKDLPYPDRSFDLVVSINTIHNLPLVEVKQALREVSRVSKGHAFITVDAWHNDEERKQMMKWNLTALTTLHVDDWQRLFSEVGYGGDYYWFIAE